MLFFNNHSKKVTKSRAHYTKPLRKKSEGQDKCFNLDPSGNTGCPSEQNSLKNSWKVKKLLNIRFFLNQNCSIRRIVKMWSAFLALSISTDVGNLIWISIYLFLHSRRSSRHLLIFMFCGSSNQFKFKP